MQSRWNRCLSGVGAVVLIGGLVLANNGGGIMLAEAHDHQREAYSHLNPFKQILAKLDEVLTRLSGGVSSSNSTSSSGVGGGNHTLRWDTNNQSASRFTPVFGGAAILDNNTGLVWEQAPDATPRDWSYRDQCLNKVVGGTRGWRLPSVVELASLIDPSLPAPFVPATFTGVQLNPYWSATSFEANTSSNKWSVNFQDGSAGTSGKSNALNIWCVRGPMQESAY